MYEENVCARVYACVCACVRMCMSVCVCVCMCVCPRACGSNGILRPSRNIKEPELSHFAEDRQHLDSFPTLSTYRPTVSMTLLTFACPTKSMETAQVLVYTLAYLPSRILRRTIAAQRAKTVFPGTNR